MKMACKRMLRLMRVPIWWTLGRKDEKTSTMIMWRSCWYHSRQASLGIKSPQTRSGRWWHAGWNAGCRWWWKAWILSWVRAVVSGEWGTNDVTNELSTLGSVLNRRVKAYSITFNPWMAQINEQNVQSLTYFCHKTCLQFYYLVISKLQFMSIS